MNDNPVKLTDYTTGKAVYAKPSACTSIRDLEAGVYDRYKSPPQVLHRRTRVDVGRETLLVLETVEEVNRLLFPKTPRVVTHRSADGLATYAIRDLESALARILSLIHRGVDNTGPYVNPVREYANLCKKGLAAAWRCSPDEIGTPDLSKLS